MDFESQLECNVCYRNDIKLNNCKNEKCTFLMCYECFNIYTNNYKYKKCPQCNINIEKPNCEKIMSRHLDKHIIKYLIAFSIASYFVGYSITNRNFPVLMIFLNTIIGIGIFGFSSACLFILYLIVKKH